jgi:transcriptional regulator with XRE-family HTH domain
MTDHALTARLAHAVREARVSRGLSVSGLAEKATVSRAMISKIERAEVQPTAALLARLSGALGLTLTELIARAEADDDRRLVRADEQPVWADPDTGYERRAVSPPSAGLIELVTVDLPAGADVRFAADTYTFIDQLIWVLAGHLRFIEGDQIHELDVGDCLHLGEPKPCAFINPTEQVCSYLVALGKRR